jgi:hypothetical protein
MTGERTAAPHPGELLPDAAATAADHLVTSSAAVCMACPPGALGPSERPRALWGWSPPDLVADTPVKRRIDRLLPRSGLPALACFAAIVGLLTLAPHLPLRAGLAADGLAALAGAAWCAVNFWRCRQAHCAVTSTGWLALSILALAEAGTGHSLISGYEQPVFLAVLAAALAFEVAWRCVCGTGALRPGASHRRSDSRAPYG